MTDRNRTVALIGALAIVTLIIIAIIGAGMTGQPVDGWLPLTLAFAVPTITGLLTAAGVRSDIATVQRTVNGHFERVSRPSVTTSPAESPDSPHTGGGGSLHPGSPPGWESQRISHRHTGNQPPPTTGVTPKIEGTHHD